jgi:Ankyrin repeat
MPLGTPLHWACFARNTLAIDTILGLGANINAVYDEMDLSTTPLALAVWFTEPEMVLHLLSKGADASVKDTQGRNLLHLMSHHLPDRHGQLTHYWHYWVRHGNWEKHVHKMRTIVNALVAAGVDLEGTRDNDRAKQTPILLAASTGRIWDAGAICAMLDADADTDGPRDGVGDTSRPTTFTFLSLYLIFYNQYSTLGLP